MSEKKPKNLIPKNLKEAKRNLEVFHKILYKEVWETGDFSESTLEGIVIAKQFVESFLQERQNQIDERPFSKKRMIDFFNRTFTKDTDKE